MSARQQLSPAHWRLLTLLGAVSFFEGYDFNVITVALTPLRHSFGIDQASASAWIAVVYLGGIPAVLLARRADRHGRRQILLVSITGYTLCTLATAASPNIASFAVLQFCARFFLVVEASIVWTIVAEELPARSRGLGFGWLAGWLAMMSALGTGWSAIVNGAIISPLHLSWRWLYIAALPVVLVVLRLRQVLSETERYRAARTSGVLTARWPTLVRPPYRGRLALLCIVAVLANLTAQATTYVVDFMESQRHLSASHASFTLVLSGAVALPVLLFAGGVSDRVGRKPVLCSFLVVSVIGLYCFFHLAHSEPALLGSLALVYIGVFGSWPTGTGFGAELFPTELRTFGNSFATSAKYVGQSASFLVAGAFIGGAGNLPRAVLILSAGPLLAAALIAARFPETGGRELEDISAVVTAAPTDTA
ncbi:MAG: MFS transporter [Acidimicrobiales bacterium]